MIRPNLPTWERSVRIVLGLVIAITAFVGLVSPWSWYVAVPGVLLAGTGLTGHCPACHVAGRGRP